MDEAKIGRDGITILNNMHFWEPKEEGDPIKVVKLFYNADFR